MVKAARQRETVKCQHCQRRFRAITWRHLTLIHGYDPEHPIEEYKRRFGLRIAISDEVRKRISEKKEEFWDGKGQHWTNEQILSEILRYYARSKPLRVPVRLSLAARRHFGTFQSAVELAGLDYVEAMGVFDRERVIATIKSLAAAGERLDSTHVRENHSALHSAAIRLFPSSWSKALAAAGLDPAAHKYNTRCRWTRESAEEWVRTRNSKRQSILARATPRDLQRFIWSRFKLSWTAFVESLGIPYPGIKKRRDWTREKVLAEIRERAKSGRPMNYKAVQREYQALVQQAKKFFGTWDAARAAADVT